jgi:Alpha-glutamyl/putrescinyl thymine pyrophosphorylase clade 3
MRPGSEHRIRQLDRALRTFAAEDYPLPGIEAGTARESFLEQLAESLRRVDYYTAIEQRHISPLRADAASPLFDPIKAALLFKRTGEFDEACWMVFVAVHFGKNRLSGWRLARDVIGRLGKAPSWTWRRISRRVTAFRQWLHGASARLRSEDGVHRAFGNHRKYQSLGGWTGNGTGEAVASYVEWVGPSKSHRVVFDEALRRSANDPRQAFDDLYRSMTQVRSFGRTARFDYLTMLANLGLVGIEPGSTYMAGATGPHTGARLLFQDRIATRPLLDRRLVRLGEHLGVPMNVIEDTLCNWQKSPTLFRPFRG